MGLLLMEGQSSTHREISMARRISVGSTVTEVSISFHPAAPIGTTAHYTASTIYPTEPAQPLGLWPSAPTALCSELPREGDTLAPPLKSPARKSAPARGRKFRPRSEERRVGEAC